MARCKGRGTLRPTAEVVRAGPAVSLTSVPGPDLHCARLTAGARGIRGMHSILELDVLLAALINLPPKAGFSMYSDIPMMSGGH